MENEHTFFPMNQGQVRNILKFIDSTQDETTKCTIFSELGRECFRGVNQSGWLTKYKGDLPGFLHMINVEQVSPHWESLILSEDGTTITLTGRKVTGCVCAFADCDDPPRSLCHHCCKVFQESYFGALLDRAVEVEITEAFLLGGERCSTRIHLG